MFAYSPGARVSVLMAVALGPLVSLVSGALGPLDPPPGPIAPTQRPLGDVEPRTPISLSTTPGDATCTYRITRPGSYYFTGNLTGEAAKIGIKISASNVTIDLRGFSLVGVPGSASGIVADGAVVNLAVHDGVVTSWGSDGINLFAGGLALNSRIEDVTSSLNGGAGIRVAGNSVVRYCIAEENAGNGFTSNSALNISHVMARSNGADGLFAGAGSCVDSCTFRDNGSRGMFASSHCTVTACAAFSNDAAGISSASSCLITGCTANANLGDGISTANECTILNNTCIGNGASASDGAGVHAAGTGNRVEGNNCVGNDRGVDVDSFGNVIVRNSCRTNGVNWDVAPGNACYVVTATASDVILGNAGGAPLAADANANITY